MKKWILLAIGAALISQACSISIGEDEDEEPVEPTEEVGRGPTGLTFEKERGDSSEFPEDDYQDGPEIDDTRASLRAIQEADIVQVVGSTLYAISAVSGLAIIDVSEQDSLKLLGTYRPEEGSPFEMYVRGDRVIALYKGVILRDDRGAWLERGSQVLTLNVADPADVKEEDSFDLPGEISDSRIVESVLYVSSYQDYGSPPETTVVSLDVSDSSNISEVDRLTFEEIQLSWSEDRDWSHRSISTSDDRLYVSGPVDEGTSNIQVIDISDTAGNMTLGASVEVEGAIFSRWQIDEYENVLRVVSQPPTRSGEEPPVVQTFAINASDDITDLGSLEMVLPQAEVLKSVRFDEDRAYAITFEETDPLFIIDLSDPATPVQAGELEMPGWVFHLEPRGDRLLGLGYDQGNTDGSLFVSLFDVSDMESPTQLERINFGPSWNGRLSEDSNRIHKVFKVMDDLGLIMVPYSGWATEQSGCGEFSTGVQLIDWENDTLTKRGLAGATGTARRAFLHDERMFAFSENQMQVFDITDRDAPARTASLPLSQRVHRTAVVGDRVVRIASDWSARVAYADVVNLADVESPKLGPSIDLAALLNEDPESCEYHDDSPFAEAEVFSFGDHLAIPVVHVVPETEAMVTDLLVLDVSGDGPELAAELRLDFEPIRTGLGSGIVQVENGLIFQRPGDGVNDDQNMQDLVLEVVDMSDPADPRLRPNRSVTKPFAADTTGLHLNGSELSSGYFAFEGDDVGYFLDRTDVSNPLTPQSETPVEFPGLSLGPLGDDFLGVDFAWRFETGSDEDECLDDGGEWDGLQDLCWFATRELQRVEINDNTASAVSSVELASDISISGVLIGDERYFLPARNASSERVLVVVGTDGDQLASTTIDLEWWQDVRSAVIVDDELLFLDSYELEIVRSDQVEDAAVESLASTWGGVHLAIAGDTAIVSRGDRGVTTVDF